MKRWTLTLLAAGCAASAVWAADGNWKPQLPKEISRADFVSHAEARFAALDADKNGIVTEAERKAARKDKRAKPSRPDLTEAQYLAAAKARFQALDTDKNGVLTSEELRAARKRHHVRPARFGHWPQGDVSRADVVRLAETRFDALDSNHDGVLTAEELKAARKAKPHHHH